jgi:hypothetical protein
MRKIKISEGEAGFAMVAAMVIIFVLGISAVGIFRMVEYETNNSSYRTQSFQALYLADSAVERAKARLLNDSSWRDGWNSVPLGNGTYSLSIQDTTYMGNMNIVRLVGTGTVDEAVRKVEAWTELPGGNFDYALLVHGDLEAKGNICIDGEAHICGDADFGNHDAHLQCGTYTEGFDVDPPTVFTEASEYPNATYYMVRGTTDGHDFMAAIFDRFGNDITGALGDDLSSVTSFDAGNGVFSFEFDKTSKVEHYFNDQTGVFRRNSGDQAVVVNFGEPPLIDPPGVTGLSNIEFKGNSGAPVVHATIINTRFIGVNDEQRFDTNYWEGGGVETKKVIFEPYYGISLLIHDFQQEAGALSQIGTSNWPGLVVVTCDVVKVRANFAMEGAIVVLGDWFNTGGPDLIYNPDFESNLPGYFRDPIINPGSGLPRIVYWQEIASGL